MDPKSIKLLARRAWIRRFLRLRAAALCEPSEVWLSRWEAKFRCPEWGEVRNGPELSQFQMKFCIGELFLEAQAGSPDFLAQAEWPRLGIHSTPLCCAL